MKAKSLNLIKKNGKSKFESKENIEVEVIRTSTSKLISDEEPLKVYGTWLSPSGLTGGGFGSSSGSGNSYIYDWNSASSSLLSLNSGINWGQQKDVVELGVDVDLDNAMDSHLSSMSDYIATNGGGENYDGMLEVDLDAANAKKEDVEGAVNGGENAVDLIETARAWDPRLYRFDAFMTTNNMLVPFATETASSAYFDMVFTIEKDAYNLAKNAKPSDDSNTSGLNGGTGDKGSPYTSSDVKGSDKIVPLGGDNLQVKALKSDPTMFGTQSLVNPYCVTRLVGGLTGTGDAMESHMYDIRDKKRFYDTDNNGSGLVEGLNSDDVTSINNPTTTNIIAWSNKDKWQRTPYSFQDFVFCKYWNIIPNNRLITFRKYAVPTYDNLNFPNMVQEDGTSALDIQVSPIATVVTYFGGDSPNKMSEFLKFTTGTKWKEISADVHKVTGDTGSNPRAVVDEMFEKGGFGGVGSASNIVNSFLGKAGGLTGQYLSFGKFVGLLSPGGYSGHNQAAWEKLTSANIDPSESIYSNRIIGPVNRIQSVQARDAGIEFGQTFSLTCEYIARPIGGINTKAAMLDILANCMEIASPEAVFWGGGYRFMIKPHMYPFNRGAGTSRVLDDLYAGKIFGRNGAIAHGLEGLLKFGTKKNADGTTSFDWATVTSNLGSVLSQTVGAIGGMLQSIGSALMGTSTNIGSWLQQAGQTVTGAAGADGQKGMQKLNSMFTNLESMWKDKVIQETTMPNLEGMKSILSGEPTGNWHITVGNPLNPIMVCGNLICKKMDVTFGEELGPDDFPLEMKVVYSIEHAMARDKAGIQSMFNRGAGKIYKLPDYIKAVSDYESKVDDYTGRTDGSFYTPKFMNAGTAQKMFGAKGYQTYKIEPGKELATIGNAETTLLAKFTPPDVERSTHLGTSPFLGNVSNRQIVYSNIGTRKRSNN